jgi:purine nucleosidase
MPLLIDTDIGTNPDDLQALMLAGSLGLDVCGITTVSGDTDRRARMAAAVAPLVGVRCPIVAGRREPLSGGDVRWAGYEGNGVPGIDTAAYDRGRSASGLIAELAAQHPGSLDIVAIGPLTNLAVALLADPSLPDRIRRVAVMGGDFSEEPAGPEHNFSSDPVAMWIVLRSGVRLTVSGFDLTCRVVLTDEDHERISASSEVGLILDANTKDFLALIAALELPGAGRGHIPHDPVALLTLIRPELFTTQACRIEAVGIGARGGHVRAIPDDTSPIQVLRGFDPDTVRRAIVDALAEA